MNQKQHNTISWWRASGSLIIALSMMVFTGYGAVTTMECLMSGNKTLQVGAADDCCESEKLPYQTIEAKCCDVSTSEFTFHNIVVPIRDFVFMPAVLFAEAHETYLAPFISERENFISHFAHAPPIPGRQILINICKYSI